MKHEKQILLDEIKREIQQYPSFLVTQYVKLSAPKANQFRREMAKIGVNFEVVRKRMLTKAAENIGVKVSLDTLPGHIGLVLAKNDPVEAAKAVLKYSKSNDDCFQLLCGRVEGHMIDAADMKRLSELPSKKEMQALLLGLFEAPMSQTLAVIESLLSSVVYCLDNKAKEAS